MDNDKHWSQEGSKWKPNIKVGAGEGWGLGTLLSLLLPVCMETLPEGYYICSLRCKVLFFVNIVVLSVKGAEVLLLPSFDV